MFKGIKNQWNEARAENLRQEVEDIVFRLQSFDEEMNFKISQYLLNTYNLVIQDYGSLDNVTNDGKKQISKQVKKLAKKVLDFNMAEGYGAFLCSAYIESQALPGQNAKIIESLVGNLIIAANEIDNNINTTGASPFNEQDIVAQKAIAAAKAIGAKTAKEAAEITMGRELTENEWSKYKEAWERNWN